MDRVAVGGMAEIFKARQSGPRGFERIVVIKRILQNLSEEQEFKQMFDDEARIVAQLRHANIVQIFELGDVSGTPYIAMEYVEGRNLRDLTRAIQAKGLKLSVEQSVYIISEVLRGLSYAHQRKDSNGNPLEIIHRDMSPQNIILSYEGEVKILDFGIAKSSARSSQTEAGVLKGKFSYMSPEQASGRPISQATDIYACGVILHELLTGERLFRAETDIETIERVKLGVVPKPSEKNSKISAELDRIVLKALQRSQEKRYQSASEMLSDMSKLMRDEAMVFGPQELSAFMNTLFHEQIQDERDRLKSAMESAARLDIKTEVQTHIAFKNETLTPPAREISRTLPESKSYGFRFLLLILFLVSLAIFLWVEKPRREENAKPAVQTPLERPPESLPEPVESPEPQAQTPEAEPPTPVKQEKPIEDILEVKKPDPIPPAAEPDRNPEPPARPTQRPSRISLPPVRIEYGSLDMLPPPEGYARLYIENRDYGFVPGEKATGIRLAAGKHQVRCESGSKIYEGEVTISANQKLRISCSELR